MPNLVSTLAFVYVADKKLANRCLTSIFLASCFIFYGMLIGPVKNFTVNGIFV